MGRQARLATGTQALAFLEEHLTGDPETVGPYPVAMRLTAVPGKQRWRVRLGAGRA